MSEIVELELPDASKVLMNTGILKFIYADKKDAERKITEAGAYIDSRLAAREYDFSLLIDNLINPAIKFSDAFRRAEHIRYMGMEAVPRFRPTLEMRPAVIGFTRSFTFPGNNFGGAFSPRRAEYNFLDGGILEQQGYGWASNSYVKIQGIEALSVICLFLGVQQPKRIKGNFTSRPLAVLLEEMNQYRFEPDNLKKLKLGRGRRNLLFLQAQEISHFKWWYGKHQKPMNQEQAVNFLLSLKEGNPNIMDTGLEIPDWVLRMPNS